MPSGFPWGKKGILFWLADFTGIGTLPRKRKEGRNPAGNRRIFKWKLAGIGVLFEKIDGPGS